MTPYNFKFGVGQWKLIAGVISIIIGLTVSLIVLVHPLLAQVPFIGFASLSPPFGGRALFVEACHLGVVVTIGPPVGGKFYYQPGVTREFLYHQTARPAVWDLGTRTITPGTCIIGFGKGGPIVTYQGVMTMVGTSLF